MLFGSLDPSPQTLRLPLGGGLQWTLLFRMRSDKAWAFRASNTNLMELDDSSLRLEGPLLTLDDPSEIESAMRYTRSKQRSNSIYMHSKSCPILKFIPEYLVQAYPPVILTWHWASLPQTT